MQKTDFAFKVVVHDDASTDKTAEIIRKFEQKYPDIIKPIYQTENQFSKKISIYKEFLLPQIEGDYVAFFRGR
jgi:glycosyltransferase involved in cell wall biosynthesis